MRNKGFGKKISFNPIIPNSIFLILSGDYEYDYDPLIYDFDPLVYDYDPVVNDYDPVGNDCDPVVKDCDPGVNS